MRRSAQVAPLSEELQSELSSRRSWLLSEPKKAFYWLLGHLRSFPADPSLHVQLSTTTRLLGERDLARGYLSQALELSPAISKVRHSYLELLIQEGRYSQALSTGLRWLKVAPAEPSLYMITGYALEKTQSFEVALAYYKQAFELGERAMFSHYLLMRAVHEVEGGARALPYAIHHFNLYPQHQEARAWLLCASIFSSSHQELADQELEARVFMAYQRALSCNPDNREAHYELALRYEHVDEARAYTHALRARGAVGGASVFLLLCRLELKRGDPYAARHALHMYKQTHKGAMSPAASELMARIEATL